MSAQDVKNNIVDGVKTVAFPILVAVIMWFGSRMFNQLDEIVKSLNSMNTSIELIKSKMDSHELRIINLEQIQQDQYQQEIQDLKDKLEAAIKKEKSSK
jgi:predicted PurR-regulated permease PerM